MKRRIIAIAVALFMVLTMVPMTGNAVYAADEVSKSIQLFEGVEGADGPDEMSSDQGNAYALNSEYDNIAMWGRMSSYDVDWMGYTPNEKSILKFTFTASTKTATITVIDCYGVVKAQKNPTTVMPNGGANGKTVYRAEFEVTADRTGALGTLFIEVKDGSASADDPYTLLIVREDAATHVCDYAAKSETTKEATCNSYGEVKETCSCGKVRYKTVTTLAPHKLGEWKQVAEATCKNAAKYERVCTVCGKGKEIKYSGEKLPHNEIVKQAAKEATCKSAGWTATIYCDKCSTYVQMGETIPALPHKEEVIPAVAATCEKTGKTEGKKCTECGTITVKQITVAKLAHEEAPLPAKEPTCEKAGREAGTYCKNCNLLLSGGAAIKALGHTKVYTSGYDATCTKDGITAGYKCSTCDAALSGATVIPATGHKEVVDKAVEATCTKTGLTEGKHCSKCKEVIVAQQEVAKKAHTPGAAATCTTAQKCTVCNTVLVAALGHKEVVDAAVAATCTTDGKTEGRHCSVCNTVFLAQNVVPAFGHNEVANVEVAATAKAEGLVKTTCTTCNEVTGEKTVAMIGTVKLAKTSYVYDGKVKAPKVTVNDVNGNPIDKANYTIKTPTGRKNTGKYTYTVTFKNEYAGQVTLTMQIAPKAPAIKAPVAMKKGATVKWTKVAGSVTGYEVLVATNAKFTKGKKTVTVKGMNVASKKITGLKAKTKYWVKVRAYKTVGKTKIYSSWSIVKTIKTK